MSIATELIVALDIDTIAVARDIVQAAEEQVLWYKVGSQLFCRTGPQAVAMLKENGKKVFLDLKYHDIPNTVANAVATAGAMGVDMVNVHASGGREMMQAAVKILAEKSGDQKPLLIGVTVLTSMDQAALAESLNLDDDYTPQNHVRHLAGLASASGMDGVVCSAHEISMIRDQCGGEFKLIVPGIRPAGSSRGDQKRVMTPGEAASLGADFIVVGRPVYQAPDPAAAAAAIVAEMANCRG